MPPTCNHASPYLSGRKSRFNRAVGIIAQQGDVAFEACAQFLGVPGQFTKSVFFSGVVESNERLSRNLWQSRTSIIPARRCGGFDVRVDQIGPWTQLWVAEAPESAVSWASECATEPTNKKTARAMAKAQVELSG